MVSYADIRRGEIWLAVTEQWPVDIPEAEWEGWQTVGTWFGLWPPAQARR